MGELVVTMRCLGELDIDDAVDRRARGDVVATMDRRLAADRASVTLRGRNHTKPGSLLKDSTPMRTWAQWDDAVSGFVDRRGRHENGNAVGDHAFR